MKIYTNQCPLCNSILCHAESDEEVDAIECLNCGGLFVYIDEDHGRACATLTELLELHKVCGEPSPNAKAAHKEYCADKWG